MLTPPRDVVTGKDELGEFEYHLFWHIDLEEVFCFTTSSVVTRLITS